MTPSRLHRPVLLGLAVCLSLFPGEAVAACSGSGEPVGQASPSTAERAVLCLINQERRQRGRGALDSNPKLEDAAGAHSRHMISTGTFSHSGSGGSSPQRRVRKSGYLRGANRWSVGETIGYQTGNASSPRNIVAGWMKSSGHRSILLDGRYRDVGIGVKRGIPSGGGKNGGTYTADFGYRGN